MNDDQHFSDAPAPAATGRRGPGPALIGLAVLVALGAAFFLQNGKRTEIYFLVFHKTTTIRWSIIVAILIGIAIDRIFGVWWSRRRRAKNSTS